jgi:hypothetical protein
MQKLTLVSFTKEDDCTAQTFSCDFFAHCAGDSIYVDTAGRQVHVTEISIITQAYDEDSIGVQVNVTHDSDWKIYTDTGFEAAISDAVGFAVNFTEQGMQEDGYASLEA